MHAGFFHHSVGTLTTLMFNSFFSPPYNPLPNCWAMEVKKPLFITARLISEVTLMVLLSLHQGIQAIC